MTCYYGSENMLKRHILSYLPPDFPQCHCKLTSKPLLERLATFLCCCFLDFLSKFPIYSNWKHTQASIWMYVLFNFPTLAAACTSCIVNTKLISATQSPNSSWLPRPQQVQDASEEQYGSKHLRIHPQQKSFGLEIPLSTLWGNSSWNWQPPSYRPPVVSCHMIYTVRSLPKYTGGFSFGHTSWCRSK